MIKTSDESPVVSRLKESITAKIETDRDGHYKYLKTTLTFTEPLYIKGNVYIELRVLTAVSRFDENRGDTNVYPLFNESPDELPLFHGVNTSRDATKVHFEMIRTLYDLYQEQENY